MTDITEIDMYDLQKLCNDYELDVDVLEADLWDIRKDLISAGWDDRNFHSARRRYKVALSSLRNRSKLRYPGRWF